ncbi:MAG: DUF4301 family protein, partial [Flavobacteriaceae bacterium]|nr:DUF4301 family protein [Flavobacteriaceae bacterium]
KNVDNVVVYQYEKDVAHQKQILGGMLLKAQEKTHAYMNLLSREEVTSDALNTIEIFLKEKLNVSLSSDFKKLSKEFKIKELKEKLNRPIRVCGMVKNEGEPGGGPFWVSKEGSDSLQIVESAQINKKDKKQQEILKSSTHFNPVNLVCGVKDYQGNKFDLLDYADHNAVFITPKTKNGKDLKALELPGLWNGAMAHWNTIFVEVPLMTFNPVKTVNDLLKSAHQIK